MVGDSPNSSPTNERRSHIYNMFFREYVNWVSVYIRSVKDLIVRQKFKELFSSSVRSNSKEEHFPCFGYLGNLRNWLTINCHKEDTKMHRLKLLRSWIIWHSLFHRAFIRQLCLLRPELLKFLGRFVRICPKDEKISKSNLVESLTFIFRP